jgi:hypothetical protein
VSGGLGQDRRTQHASRAQPGEFQMKHTLADEEARLAEKSAEFVTPKYVSPFSIIWRTVCSTPTTAP